jgi:hypothetical protein
MKKTIAPWVAVLLFVTLSGIWSAFSTAKVSAATCGNGIVEAGEQCDAGVQNGVCPSACSRSCTTGTDTCNTSNAQQGSGSGDSGSIGKQLTDLFGKIFGGGGAGAGTSADTSQFTNSADAASKNAALLKASGGTAADAMCAPEKGMCQYGTCCDKYCTILGVVNKPCFDFTNGVVSGRCTGPIKCRADSASGVGGGSGAVGFGPIVQALMGLMGKTSAGGNADPGAVPGGCPTRYKVDYPSSDPCADYSPGVSAGLLSPDMQDLSGEINNPVSKNLLALLRGNQVEEPLSPLPTSLEHPTQTTAPAAETHASASVVVDINPPSNNYVFPQNPRLSGGVNNETGTLSVVAYTDSSASSAFFGGLDICEKKPWESGLAAFPSTIPILAFKAYCWWNGGSKTHTVSI